MKAIPLSELIGQRFGRLVCIEQRGKIGRVRAFLFRCDCGTEKQLAAGSVRSGGTKSCGCLHADNNRTLKRYKGAHGECHKTPEHRSWQAMLARCTNSSHVAYSNYGGRGIKVCQQWQGKGGYAQFLADMGRRPSLAHTLDRINGDGDYEPQNCRWADKATQLKNRRVARLIEVDGEMVNVSVAAERAGISRALLRYRLNKGWPVDRALSTPPDTRWKKPRD